MSRKKHNLDDRQYKGKVGVTTDKGMLRLILPRSVSGILPRKISLGLHDTPENRKIAEAKAMVIQGDIGLGQLDITDRRSRYWAHRPPENTQKRKIAYVAFVIPP